MSLLNNFKEIGRDFKKLGKDVGAGGGDGLGTNFKKLGKDIGVTAVKNSKDRDKKTSDWAEKDEPDDDSSSDAEN